MCNLNLIILTYPLYSYSVDNLEKFVNDFMSGAIESYMKSEPIPEDSGEAVKVAIADL